MTRPRPIDLAAITARADAATPGPWYTFSSPWFHDELGVLAGSPDPHVAKFVADISPMDALDDDADQWAQNPADAKFIAAARDDIPALVAEVKRLQTEASTARILIRWAAAQPCQCEDVAYGGSGGPTCAPCDAKTFLAEGRRP